MAIDIGVENKSILIGRHGLINLMGEVWFCGRQRCSKEHSSKGEALNCVHPPNKPVRMWRCPNGECGKINFTIFKNCPVCGTGRG